MSTFDIIMVIIRGLISGRDNLSKLAFGFRIWVWVLGSGKFQY